MTDISLDQDERKVLDWVESRGDHMIDTVKAWSQDQFRQPQSRRARDHAVCFVRRVFRA
jgi:hypothetical protein